VIAMTNEIPQITLNNGVQMPVLGFGVYQVPSEQTEQAVTDALAAGYRSLDTAAYGNEEAVGRAIANSDIPRDKPFVTTKLWIQKPGEENAKRAFAASLEQLGLDDVDLYLIHQSFAEGKNNLFSNPTLSEIGTAHGKSVAQIVLRWLTQRAVVAIPKSVRPDRMAENIDIFDIELIDEQMTRIAALDTGASQFFDHHDPAIVGWLGNRRDD
jgi:diketogulonate reductase-like aldo/keto reductase